MLGFDFQSWRICMGKDRRFSFWASGPKRLHSHVWSVEGGQSKSNSNPVSVLFYIYGPTLNVPTRGAVLLSKWLDRFEAKDGVFRKVAVAHCQSKSSTKTRMKPDRRLRESECSVYAAPGKRLVLRPCLLRTSR